jgi:hypothetical protein
LYPKKSKEKLPLIAALLVVTSNWAALARKTPMEIRCYLTILWKSKWVPLLSRLQEFLHEHGFRQSEYTSESWDTFEVSATPEEVANLVTAYLDWLDKAGFGDQQTPPPWSIVATAKRIVEAKEGQRILHTLPKWVLVEFFNTFLLEESALAALHEIAPALANKFEFRSQMGLHEWRWSPSPSHQQPKKPKLGEEIEVELRQMRNGPDAQPQKSRISVRGFEDISRTAGEAYADIPAQLDVGIGGVNALILLSAERNGIRGLTEPEGTFVLYNVKALGLQTTKLNEAVSNLVRNRKIEVLEVIAEPSEEIHNELPDSDEGQR